MVMMGQEEPLVELKNLEKGPDHSLLQAQTEEPQDHPYPPSAHHHQDRACWLIATTETQRAIDFSTPGILRGEDYEHMVYRAPTPNDKIELGYHRACCICGHRCKLILEICAEQEELLVGESSASEDLDGH